MPLNFAHQTSSRIGNEHSDHTNSTFTENMANRSITHHLLIDGRNVTSAYNPAEAILIVEFFTEFIRRLHRTAPCDD